MPSPSHDPDPRRRAPRHSTSAQRSTLGEVLDLSRLGMKVAGTGRPPAKLGDTTVVGLSAPEGTLRLKARVVWLRKPGLRKWELGLEFVEIDRRRQTAVERLARFGCLTGVPGASTPTDHWDEDDEAAPAAAAGPADSTRALPPPAVQVRFEEPDHYRALQLQPDADDARIREAFRMLAKQLHPDRNPAPDAQLKFDAVKQAYDVLRHAADRAAYDERREHAA